MSVISVDHLSKVYKRPIRSKSGWISDLFHREHEDVVALDEVSFALEPAEFVGYVGLNGAGKTTTMKILAGILRPTSGTVSVLGYTPWRRKHEFLRRIGFVMGQKRQLWWDLPAADFYSYLQALYAIPNDKYKETLGRMAEMLAVDGLLDVPVRNLSLGERAKVELIAALLHDPDVVFLDEPTLGMDVLAQKSMRAFFSEYNRQFGKTMLLTTHSLSDVEALCSRIIIIHEGQILWDGSVSELLQRYEERRLVRLRVERNGAIEDVAVEVPKGEVGRVLSEWSSLGRVLEYREEGLRLEGVLAHMLGGDS